MQHRTLLLMACRVANQVVGERFGNDKKEHNDMLGSFLRHGLSQREAESEVLAQMFALPVPC